MKIGLLHPRTLLIVAALCAACGEDGYSADDFDDQTGDPSNAGGWDAGNQGGGTGGTGGAGADAGRADGSVPWDARFDAGGPAPGWDAGAAPDAAWNSGSDAGRADAAIGTDAAAADAGSDASRADASTPDAASNTCTLTYANFGQQFLTSYCVGCHGAVSPRAGVRLDSLGGITARKVQAKAAVLNSIMPQGTNRPSAADRERFGQWIDCGPN
jgi:hypothetical protein